MNWPPDYKAEFKRRLKIVDFINRNPDKWPLIRENYKHNPIKWINDFCITYDPRAKSPLPKTMPFILFPKQEELVLLLWECIRRGESALIEKSRDMGASWVCVAFTLWLWIFWPGTAVGWGSRKAEYVDKIGDPKSIFQKMRMTLKKLPRFMLPGGYLAKEHFTYMRLVNPENGATVTGEAGDNIGRGGRTTIYFKDESAHYEQAENIEAALGDNTDCQIDISSVNGPNNVFYRRRMAGVMWELGKKIKKGYTRIFIMDWKDHPGKSLKWYERRRAKAEREGLLHKFAQEVDRDYLSSLDRIIISLAWIKASIDAHLRPELGITDEGEKVAALDVADEGGDKNALAGRYGVILKYAEDWSKGDTSETALRAVSKTRELGINELFYDAVGVGAGVKGETNRLRRENKIPGHMKIRPWKGSSAVQNPDKHMIQGDRDTPLNKNQFANLKAQAWWSLSQRFYKTYMAVTKGLKYRPEELISIPSTIQNLHQIELELAQATQNDTESGKMKVDKKPKGGKSPNLADAIVSCYYPVRTGIDYSKGLNK